MEKSVALKQKKLNDYSIGGALSLNLKQNCLFKYLNKSIDLK